MCLRLTRPWEQHLHDMTLKTWTLRCIKFQWFQFHTCGANGWFHLFRPRKILQPGSNTADKRWNIQMSTYFWPFSFFAEYFLINEHKRNQRTVTPSWVLRVQCSGTDTSVMINQPEQTNSALYSFILVAFRILHFNLAQSTHPFIIHHPSSSIHPSICFE